jgi:DNA-binding transcriptional LysR family regulator
LPAGASIFPGITSAPFLRSLPANCGFPTGNFAVRHRAHLRLAMSLPILPFMDKIGVELRLLANFISACQNARISDAAASLGQTPSALSMALRKLEDRLGMRLFVRQGGYLGLLPAAFWLFRQSCQLLYLEEYARSAFSLPHARLDRLVVHLDLSLAIGRFSKALMLATQETMRQHPETFVEWRVVGQDDGADAACLRSQLDGVFVGGTEVVRIFYDAAADAPATTHLFDDRWIVVGSSDSHLDLSPAADPIAVLKMRPRLIEAISTHVDGGELDGRLRFLEDDPAQLASLLQEFPHLRFLIPASMLADRMGLARLEWAPLKPALVSRLVGQTEAKGTGKGNGFLQSLKRNLAGEERNIVFEPKLTLRQIQYFNLACRSGGISAAARVANVSQSSLSAQIHKMESIAGADLLDRHRDGSALSASGNGFRPFATAIEERQASLLRISRDIAAHSQANVRIGTLPSSGHDSALTEKIARAITAVHASHPTWKLQVSESSNAVLHDRIRAGELNIAIVGAAQPQVARISLGSSEALSVVANPQLRLPDVKEMTLDEVCRLPLVLGVRQLSIHQNVALAAKARNIHLAAVIEVGSLALAIAMVRNAPLCTVLPASSVRKDLMARTLVAVPINRDEVPGALSIIFSADRSLSDAERVIVQELVNIFKEGGTAAGALDHKIGKD